MVKDEQRRVVVVGFFVRRQGLFCDEVFADKNRGCRVIEEANVNDEEMQHEAVV